MTLAYNGTGGDAAEQPASDDNMLVQTASFRGDISANENVDLEFYWNPDTEGEYVPLLPVLASLRLNRCVAHARLAHCCFYAGRKL